MDRYGLARFPRKTHVGPAPRIESCFSRIINGLAKATQGFGDLHSQSLSPRRLPEMVITHCVRTNEERRKPASLKPKSPPTLGECLVMTQRAATCAADRCKQSSCPHADSRENHGSNGVPFLHVRFSFHQN
jgi:hypothetical protein